MKIRSDMKEYVAIDVRGQDVPGTNTYHKRKPRTGRWRLITPQPCCSAFALTATLADNTDDTFAVTVLCDATTILVGTIILPVATTSLDEVISGLRKYASYIGKWSTDGTLVELQLNTEIARQCSGTLSFTIAAA